MKHLAPLVVLACSAVMLGGCYPVNKTTWPAVNGVVQLDGKALTDAKVYVHKWFPKEGCEESPKSDTTDGAGKFSVTGLREWEWEGFGDRYTNVGVCIEHNGTWYRAYRENHMGFPLPKLRLVCDLARELPVRRDGTEGGYCRREE